MKRYGLLILVVGLLLTCMAVAETGLDDETRVAYEVSEEELVRIAQQDFPDWMVADSTCFWSGSYEDRLACWENINLFRIGEGTLEQMELAVLVNPLKSGDTVPWGITEIAPIPVNEEAAEAILEAYRTGELFTIYDTQIPENALTGCAVSFLEEGEHWRQLYAYPVFLAGVAMNDENQSVIRIAHWDGKKYDRLIRSQYQEEWLSIWEDSSYNDQLTIDGDLFVCQPDGRWILQEIEGEPSIITIGDGYITDAGWWGYFDSNDVCHYGVPTFETDLERIDFSTIPYFMPDAVRQLNSDGYACVRTD